MEEEKDEMLLWEIVKCENKKFLERLVSMSSWSGYSTKLESGFLACGGMHDALGGSWYETMFV